MKETLLMSLGVSVEKGNPQNDDRHNPSFCTYISTWLSQAKKANLRLKILTDSVSLVDWWGYTFIALQQFSCYLFVWGLSKALGELHREAPGCVKMRLEVEECSKNDKEILEMLKMNTWGEKYSSNRLCL